MNDNKKRDIFYGVVAIATLIIALVGATLAYFSIAVSSKEGAVDATAAVVSIDYEDGQQVSIQATELIPSSFEVVKNSYETYVLGSSPVDLENLEEEAPKCVDSNGRQVCSTYRFSIGNNTDEPVTATLNAEHNGFVTESLSYAVYDLVNNKWLDLENDGSNTHQFVTFTTACSKEGTEDMSACYSINGTEKTYIADASKSIFGYTTTDGVKNVNALRGREQKYEIVLFINETNENQNADQGKSFQGTIKVDLTQNAGNITGKWNN